MKDCQYKSTCSREPNTCMYFKLGGFDCQYTEQDYNTNYTIKNYNTNNFKKIDIPKSGINPLKLIFILLIICVGIPIFNNYQSADHTTITIPTIQASIGGFEQSPKTISYPYVIDGKKGSISYTTYSELSNRFSKEDHLYYEDPVKEITMELLENNDQDTYLKPLIDNIKKQSSNPDDQAKIAISLVQHIPYDKKKADSDSHDLYYPYETLYLNLGICADQSYLLAYLLNELGYDVILFEFKSEQHAAIGIKSDPKYDYKDTGYAFIETTTPSIITDSDGIYGGVKLTSTPHIIHLNGGTKSLDVSEEYNDAIRMNQLDSTESTFSITQYNEWESIKSKYDLQYT